MASGVASRKLFSYVVAHDSGFAPCPYGRYCTLAYCKPDVRKIANVGDWVIGTGSKRNKMSRRLIYAMEVTKKVPFQEYCKGKKYKGRQDNKGYHCTHTTKAQREKDQRGKFALVSNNFYYFGEKALPLNGFQLLIKKGPKHKTFKGKKLLEEFIAWLKGKYPKKGKLGDPIEKLNCANRLSCKASRKLHSRNI